MMKILKANIYFKELSNYKKSLFFWSLGVIGFLLAAMGKYQGYEASKIPIADLFKDLPSGLTSFFGIGQIDLGTVSGWFAILVLYLAILLGVHAVLLGSGIIAKEETDKTAEFLFSKPISRNQVFFSKVLAAFTIMTALSIITTISSVYVVEAFNKGPSAINDILLLSPSIFFIQLIFLTIGISFASIMKRPKRAVMFSAAVLLTTFILSVFIEMTDKFDFLKYLTPFAYFDAKTIFLDRGYNILYIVILLVFVISFLIISKIYFKKRDLSI